MISEGIKINNSLKFGNIKSMKYFMKIKEFTMKIFTESP